MYLTIYIYYFISFSYISTVSPLEMEPVDLWPPDIPPPRHPSGYQRQWRALTAATSDSLPLRS